MAPVRRSTDQSNGLSAEEFREALYEKLKGEGLVQSLKTQLRRHLVSQLHTRSQVKDTRTQLSISEQLVHCFTEDFLRRYPYTLSVFHSEAGDCRLSVEEATKYLNIADSSTPAGGWLTRVVTSVSALDRRDSSNQTDRSAPLAERLRLVDEAASPYPQTGNVGVESRLSEISNRMEKEYQERLEHDITAWRESALLKLKSESDERVRSELSTLKAQLHLDWSDKLKDLQKRETELAENVSARAKEAEQQLYAQRQQLLLQMEEVKREQRALLGQKENDLKMRQIAEAGVQQREASSAALESAVRARESDMGVRIAAETERARAEERAKYQHTTEGGIAAAHAIETGLLKQQLIGAQAEVARLQELAQHKADVAETARVKSFAAENMQLKHLVAEQSQKVLTLERLVDDLRYQLQQYEKTFEEAASRHERMSTTAKQQSHHHTWMEELSSAEVSCDEDGAAMRGRLAQLGREADKLEEVYRRLDIRQQIPVISGLLSTDMRESLSKLSKPPPPPPKELVSSLNFGRPSNPTPSLSKLPAVYDQPTVVSGATVASTAVLPSDTSFEPLTVSGLGAELQQYSFHSTYSSPPRQSHTGSWFAETVADTTLRPSLLAPDSYIQSSFMRDVDIRGMASTAVAPAQYPPHTNLPPSLGYTHPEVSPIPEMTTTNPPPAFNASVITTGPLLGDHDQLHTSPGGVQMSASELAPSTPTRADNVVNFKSPPVDMTIAADVEPLTTEMLSNIRPSAVVGGRVAEFGNRTTELGSDFALSSGLIDELATSRQESFSALPLDHSHGGSKRVTPSSDAIAGQPLPEHSSDNLTPIAVSDPDIDPVMAAYMARVAAAKEPTEQPQVAPRDASDHTITEELAERTPREDSDSDFF